MGRFAQARLEREPQAAPHEVAKTREKDLRSPFLALPVVPVGAAAQNLLRMVGCGSALTSRKAIGVALSHGKRKPRPRVADCVSHLWMWMN